jgi:hypothetical protein
MIAELEKERENILFTELNKEDEAEVEAKLRTASVFNVKTVG